LIPAYFIGANSNFCARRGIFTVALSGSMRTATALVILALAAVSDPTIDALGLPVTLPFS